MELRELCMLRIRFGSGIGVGASSVVFAGAELAALNGGLHQTKCQQKSCFALLIGWMECCFELKPDVAAQLLILRESPSLEDATIITSAFALIILWQRSCENLHVASSSDHTVSSRFFGRDQRCCAIHTP